MTLYIFVIQCIKTLCDLSVTRVILLPGSIFRVSSVSDKLADFNDRPMIDRRVQHSSAQASTRTNTKTQDCMNLKREIEIELCLGEAVDLDTTRELIKQTKA